MNIDLSVKAILEQFEGFFAKPKGLPPKRIKDHKIDFKEGTLPVSIVRPYKDSFYKKNLRLQR